MVLLVIVLVTIWLFIWVKSIFDKRKLYAFSKTLPGPKINWPVVGHGLIFAVPQKEILKAIVAAFEKYGSPARYWLGPEFYVFIDKPDDIEATLNSCMTLNKGAVYDIIADCIGYGLIQSSGPRHKIHRKILIPPLKQKILNDNIHVFDEKGAECARNLEKYVGKGPVDVKEDIEYSVMALVFQMMMGVEVKSCDPKNRLMVESMNKLYKSISERTYKAWLHPYWIFRMTKHYKIQREEINRVKAYLLELMETRKKELKDSGNDININDQTVPLDLLLLYEDSNGNKVFTDEDIMGEVITLFTASEDTIMTIACFAILMLAMHKDVQEKCWLEQVSVLGSDGDPAVPILPHHLENMTYLHMVVQETLRLFPIAVTITRKTSGEFQMGNLQIPKDTNIFINIFRVQRNKDIWSDPEKFDPMRFTAEEVAKRHPYSFIAFSGGPRGCIGTKFAYMGLKSVLSHIIRNYVLHSNWTMENLEIDGDISVRSTHGYKVEISKRKIYN